MVGLGGHRGYGSPLGPEEDIWYRSREWGQNKLDKHPSQTMIANNLVNGDTKVDCVSQWTLEVFPHPQINQLNRISELPYPPGQNPWSVHHIGTLKAWKK